MLTIKSPVYGATYQLYCAKERNESYSAEQDENGIFLSQGLDVYLLASDPDSFEQ